MAGPQPKTVHSLRSQKYATYLVETRGYMRCAFSLQVALAQVDGGQSTTTRKSARQKVSTVRADIVPRHLERLKACAFWQASRKVCCTLCEMRA